MEAASASAFPSVSSAFLVAAELIDATSLSFWPLIFAASPRPSERKRAAIWCRSLDMRSIIFSATAGLYLLRLKRSSSSSMPKSEIFWRVRSVICFSISPRPSWISGIVLGNSVPLFSSSSSRCGRSEEHTSELQSRVDLVCRLLLEKKKKKNTKKHEQNYKQ